MLILIPLSFVANIVVVLKKEEETVLVGYIDTSVSMYPTSSGVPGILEKQEAATKTFSQQ